MRLLIVQHDLRNYYFSLDVKEIEQHQAKIKQTNKKQSVDRSEKSRKLTELGDIGQQE